MNASTDIKEKEENSTAKVEQSGEIVEFCNVKKILRHLAPKDTMDTPRVTLDLVMDSIKVETQLEIEAEVDKLMGKIKAIMQKDVTQVEQVYEVEMNELEGMDLNADEVDETRTRLKYSVTENLIDGTLKIRPLEAEEIMLQGEEEINFFVETILSHNLVKVDKRGEVNEQEVKSDYVVELSQEELEKEKNMQEMKRRFYLGKKIAEENYTDEKLSTVLDEMTRFRKILKQVREECNDSITTLQEVLVQAGSYAANVKEWNWN